MIGRNLNDEIKHCPFTENESQRYINICNSIFRFLVHQHQEFTVSAASTLGMHALSFHIDDIMLKVYDEVFDITFRYFRNDAINICSPLFSIPTKGNYTMMVRNTVSHYNNNTPREDMFNQLGYHFYNTIYMIFHNEVFRSPDTTITNLFMDNSTCNNKELLIMFTKIKSAIIHSLQETTHIDYELKFEDNSFRVYLLPEKNVYLRLKVYDNSCCVSIFKDGCKLIKSHILDYFGSKMLHNLRKAFDDTREYYNKINGIDTSNGQKNKNEKTTVITDINQCGNKLVINTTKTEESIMNDNMFENFNDSLIEKVIYNNPQVTVIWKDGTKTSARTNHTEDVEFVPAIGLALCIAKKFYGSQHKMLKKIPKDAAEHKLSKKEIKKTKKKENEET